MDLEARKVLLSNNFLAELNMDEYVSEIYHRSVSETPRLDEDTPEEARRREISYLNLKWFMQTLLDRMDRTSMYSGLEAKSSFCRPQHYRISLEYSLAYQSKDGVVKHILRKKERIFTRRNIVP